MSTSRSLAKLFFSEASLCPWLFLLALVVHLMDYMKVYLYLPPCRYGPHRVLLSQFFVCTWPLECVLASFPDCMPRNETTLCIGMVSYDMRGIQWNADVIVDCHVAIVYCRIIVYSVSSSTVHHHIGINT